MVFLHIISNLSSLYSNFDCDDTSSCHISVCKKKKEKGVKRVAARNNNWWPEMNARKARNCTAMYVEYVDHMIYGGQGSHLSQAASVFSDTDLTLGPFFWSVFTVLYPCCM